MARRARNSRSCSASACDSGGARYHDSRQIWLGRGSSLCEFCQVVPSVGDRLCSVRIRLRSDTHSGPIRTPVPAFSDTPRCQRRSNTGPLTAAEVRPRRRCPSRRALTACLGDQVGVGPTPGMSCITSVILL